MFYINELVFRCFYIVSSFVITLIIGYFNKSVLVFSFTQSILTLDSETLLKVDHFIYTHPLELLTVQISLIFYFSIFLSIPYFLWQLIDFLKSGLTEREYKKICKIKSIFLIILYSSNLVCFIYLFPNIWFFFETFNSTLTLQVSNFFLELRIYEYFCFIKDFIYLVNLSFSFLIILFFLFLYYGFKSLIHWKKLFILLNMMFATLLSPPDVYSQLIIFCFLTFILEGLILFFIVMYKLYKYIFFNMVTY